MAVFITREISGKEEFGLTSASCTSGKPQVRPHEKKGHAINNGVAAVGDSENFGLLKSMTKLENLQVAEVDINGKRLIGDNRLNRQPLLANCTANELINVCYAKMWRTSNNNSSFEAREPAVDLGSINNNMGHDYYTASISCLHGQKDLDKLRKLRRRSRRRSSWKYVSRDEAQKWCEGPEKFVSAIMDIRERRQLGDGDTKGHFGNIEEGMGLDRKGSDVTESKSHSVNAEERRGLEGNVSGDKGLSVNTEEGRGLEGNGRDVTDTKKYPANREEGGGKERLVRNIGTRGGLENRSKDDLWERKELDIEWNTMDLVDQNVSSLVNCCRESIHEPKGLEGNSVDTRNTGVHIEKRSGNDGFLYPERSHAGNFLKNQVHFPAHVLLCSAVQDNDHHEVDRIIKNNKIDLDNCEQSNQYYLHKTVAGDKFECARTLIEHGIDVNGKDGDGISPIALAFRLRNFRMVALLVEAGANMAEYTASRLDEMSKVKLLASSVSKVFEMEL